MAPISASPAAPQATHRISYGISDVLKDNRKLAIYVAAIATLVALFLFTGGYLLYLRRTRLRQTAGGNAVTNAVDVEGQEKAENMKSDISLHVAVGGHKDKRLAQKVVENKLETSVSSR